MELNIDELEFQNNPFGYNQEMHFDEIPENIVPVKVIKKGVHFAETSKPIHQQIPKENARMVRPTMPKPKQQISYEDILSKMGMFVENGKLHLMDNNPQKYQQIQQQINQQNQIQAETNVPQDSYIYNKYFKEDLQTHQNVRRPLTKDDYKRMLLEDILQKQRINQMKSKKLLMPTANINMSGGNPSNLNKLFNFSKR
jgi:hypothetical protein